MIVRTLTDDRHILKSRKCVFCYTSLSESFWDSKPCAIRLDKNRVNYNCISCAVKGNKYGQTTIDELKKFFHLEDISKPIDNFEYVHTEPPKSVRPTVVNQKTDGLPPDVQYTVTRRYLKSLIRQIVKAELESYRLEETKIV